VSLGTGTWQLEYIQKLYLNPAYELMSKDCKLSEMHHSLNPLDLIVRNPDLHIHALSEFRVLLTFRRYVVTPNQVESFPNDPELGFNSLLHVTLKRIDQRAEFSLELPHQASEKVIACKCAVDDAFTSRMTPST
jgi:hypothetical protein